MMLADILLTEQLSPKATVSILHPLKRAAKSRPIRVYLAARYDHLSLMQQYKHRLEQAGFEVTARWVTGAHDAYETNFGMRQLFAVEDYQDILGADWVICFTEQPGSGSTRGGRHTEFGIALGLNKRCVIIGPQENVFHYLPQLTRYETWEDFYECEVVDG